MLVRSSLATCCEVWLLLNDWCDRADRHRMSSSKHTKAHVKLHTDWSSIYCTYWFWISWMVNALLPTPPAEKNKVKLAVSLAGSNVYGDHLENAPIDRTFCGSTGKQHWVSKLPPTTTSLYSVMAYKGHTSRDSPSFTREICCFFDEMPGFLFYNVVWPATQPAHGKWGTGGFIYHN